MFIDLLSGPMVAFTSAIILMALIGIFELVGLSANLLDVDLDSDVPDWLDWLGLGRLPLMILLVAFLACFGTIGLLTQQLAVALLGAPFTPLLAVPAVAAVSLPLTGLVGRGLARIIPQDETTAYPVDGLTGLSGTIVVGVAAAGSPARAAVRDPHGQRHFVFVEPVDRSLTYGEGEEVLLVRREGDIFRVVHTQPPMWSLP